MNINRLAFATDEQRWAALQARDPAADACFVYAVRTTGVYAAPSTAARLPRRENVVFFTSAEQAQAAGYRPSRRATPSRHTLAEQHAALVAAACRQIETAAVPPSLNALAAYVGMSPFHFHRMFKAATGLTPKAYASAQRARRLREALAGDTATVTDAIYDAGFQSSSRFYATSDARLGMAASAWRKGGQGERIRFAVGQSQLGAILVAQSARGICAIFLGDDADALVRDLQDQFPRAELVGADAAFEQWVAQVVGFVEQPAIGLALPLDVRGTAFQERVWQALREIPAGHTTSYTEIAERIGQPRAVRAVAQACGANLLAVAIPCHRVVRRDGDISGYRWGVERKQQLLAREQAD